MSGEIEELRLDQCRQYSNSGSPNSPHCLPKCGLTWHANTMMEGEPLRVQSTRASEVTEEEGPSQVKSECRTGKMEHE